MAENIHVLLCSERDGTIEPDDIIRLMSSSIAIDWEDIPTVKTIENMMRDYFADEGKYPPVLHMFTICRQCDKLMVFDGEFDDWLHVAQTACPENRDLENAIMFVHHER